jgi:hypothetical protein
VPVNGNAAIRSGDRENVEDLTAMSKERSELANLALQFYRDQKKAVDLIRIRTPQSGFEPAVRRLCGDNPKPGKAIKIGGCELRFSSLASSLVSFMPARWQEELDKTQGIWRGCENWWAGYPLILYVEMRAGDDGRSGHLNLHAEVGPISAHAVRKGVIEAIEAAASVSKLGRIQFPAGAAGERQLYSRFLVRNSATVNDMRKADEVEGKFVQLVGGFEAEIDLITSVVPRLPFEPA